MFKLTKEERDQKAILVDSLSKATDNVLRESNEENIDAYNVCINDIESFSVEVGSRLRDEFDEKSEKWQESDAAASVNDLIETWECCGFDEIDSDVDEAELKSTLDIFENLPEDLG